ncbi:MAG TPA: Na+ dependent nucleoside transporter N-terminal domain-containing protein, partial [Novosphingobium sp.]|nr:Na+ dependent nucleoside transporter N-terminal domain-containing protein [Novosphingobium sp.]
MPGRRASSSSARRSNSRRQRGGNAEPSGTDGHCRLSEDRKARPGWGWIAGALLLQLAIALVVTRVPFVWTLVGYANRAVAAIEAATLVGSSYMFGYTGGAPIPFLLKPGAEPPVIIAFQILPLIIVFSAISALLWHWGVLRAVVRGLSWALQRTLGVSGVVGLG